VVVKVLSPIATGCVLNQSYGHWLLGDMLQFIITKTHEVRDEVGHVVNLDGTGDQKANTFDVELAYLVILMKCQILEVLQPFLYFMHAFEKKKAQYVGVDV
jgi:hypothetical protein